MQNRSLQRSLLRARDEWFTLRLLAQAETDADEIAHALVRNNPYGENDALASAIEQVGLPGHTEQIRIHLSHRLWCEARTARWLLNEPLPPLDFEIQGEAWYAESKQRPTILVVPMNLAQPDALTAVTRVASGRRVVVYGEGVEDIPGVEVAGDGLSAVRRIRDVLAEGGLFCTYADFAYSNHPTVQTTIFGRTRPMSSGFLSFAQQKNVLLLPLTLTMDSTRQVCTLSFAEGFSFNDGEDEDIDILGSQESTLSTVPHASQRARALPLVAAQVASEMESMISRMPLQWLLLPTLAFETHQ